MDSTEIKEIVLEIIESLLPEFNANELMSLKSTTTDAWDSMLQVNLIAALEGEFDLVIELNDAISLTSVDLCIDYIERNL